MRPLINLQDALEHHAGAGAGVPSPCVSICELDETLGRCKGCYRTLPEIASWGGLTDTDKRGVWARIEARQISPSAWEQP